MSAPDARVPGVGGPALCRSTSAEDAIPPKGTTRARPVDTCRAVLAERKLCSTDRLTIEERREIAALLHRLAASESLARRFVGVMHALAMTAALEAVEAETAP